MPPYLILEKPSHSNNKSDLSGIAVDITNIIFKYFGSNIKFKKEDQWVIFNGSRVTEGNIGKGGSK